MSTLDLAQSALLALVDASLKTLLLLLAAGLFAVVARSASARVRHLVWSLGLGGALLLLPLGALAPDWSIPGLQIPSPFEENVLAAASPMEQSPALLTASPAQGETPVTLTDDPLPALAEASPRALSLPPLELLILAAWALGLGGVLLWKGAGLARARALVARSTEAPAPLQRELRALAKRLGLRRSVELLLSNEVGTPLTMGARHPVIILPFGSSSWSAEELRMVLLHELIHVRRGDWLLKQLVHLAVALYWWLPLSWVAMRRFDIEQELSCDELVLAEGARPSDYAGLLLDMAGRLGRPSLAPLPALDMARRSQMEGRLMAILDKTPRRKSPLLVVPLLLTLVALVPALALVHPWLIEDPIFAPAAIEESEVASGENRARLKELIRELDTATEDIEAAAEEIEAVVEARMEPIHEELEARIEKGLEPHVAQIEAIHEEMAPLHEELEAIVESMEPFHSKIEKYAHEMEALAEAGKFNSEEMRALEDAMRNIEIDLEPFENKMRDVEARMSPFEKRMHEVEVLMGPVEKELEALELELAPLEAELEALEVRMEPFEAKIEALADELEERLAAELRAMVVAEVELAGLSARDESEAIDRVVERVMDGHGIHINEGALTMSVSIPRTRSVIDEAFEGRLPAENAERLAEAFARFEVR